MLVVSAACVSATECTLKGTLRYWWGKLIVDSPGVGKSSHPRLPSLALEWYFKMRRLTQFPPLRSPAVNEDLCGEGTTDLTLIDIHLKADGVCVLIDRSWDSETSLRNYIGNIHIVVTWGFEFKVIYFTKGVNMLEMFTKLCYWMIRELSITYRLSILSVGGYKIFIV